MNKQLISILLILTSILSYSQESEISQRNSLHIGLTFSPDYCYRTLRTDPSYQDWADQQNSSQIPKFGYTTGINAILKFNKSIALEMGVQFSDKGMQTKMIKIEQEDPDQSIPDEIHNTWHYYYIDIPIKANYFILKGKLNLFVSPGLSTNIFWVQKRVHSEFNPDNEETYFMSEGFNRFNMAVLFGTGIDYFFSKKFNLRIEPIFRYSLTPLNNSELKRYQYSIGANFGLYYKLK